MHPDEPRFWKKVAKGADDDCWEWKTTKSPDGYGHFHHDGGKLINSHRFAYMICRGEIPPGKIICHECDNPGCCNPRHLYVGTHEDNMRDRQMKGRTARGERHGMSRLTAADVRMMRLSPASVPDIARTLGIGETTVRDIRARRTWAGVV
jgi:hypothetical protein